MKLLAQFRDWEKFRDFQRRVRCDHGTPESPFSDYVDRVRECRQMHELGGDVRLRFSLDGKNRKLENWIEFQAYHIHIYIEKFEKKLGVQKAMMEDLQK